MVKHVIAIALICLFATVASWAVGIEGQSHRERLHPTIVVATTPLLVKPPDPGSIPRQDEPKELPQLVGSLSEERKVVTTQDSTPPEPKTVEKSPAPVVAAKSVLDPFWEQPEQKKYWDLKRFTIEDEHQLGRAMHEAILHVHQRKPPGRDLERLEEAADPFLAARERQGVKYKFTVLDCPESNIFSHPGGYIYACNGLFDLIGESEVDALAFAVGHEVAHIDQMHGLSCFTDQSWATLGEGTSPLFTTVILPQAFAEEQEYAADRWAFDVMRKAGGTKRQTLAFLRKLRPPPVDDRFKAPVVPPPVLPLDKHLSAHVSAYKRLKPLEQLWELGQPPR